MEVVKGAEFLLGSVPCALGPRELCTCPLRHPHKISFFSVCPHPNPGNSNPGQVLGRGGIAHYPHFRSPNRRGVKSNSETNTPRLKSCGCVLSHLAVMSNSDPMDCSPPSSSVHGILQARILEWVAMPSYRESFLPRD